MHLKTAQLFLLTLLISGSATLMPMARVRTIGRYAAAAIAKSYKKIGSNVATGAAIISSPVAKFMAKHPIVKGLARGAAIIVAAYAAAVFLVLTVFYIIENGPAMVWRARAVGRAIINTPGRIKNSITTGLLHSRIPALVMRGINMRATQTGMQPVFVAAHEGIIAGLSRLVTLENINTPNGLGTTLLAEAAAQGHEEAVQWLLAHGANPAIANDRGDRAIDRAEASGHDGVVNILTRHALRAHAPEASPVIHEPEQEASPVIYEPEQEAPAANRPATDPTIECPICISDTQDFVTLTCGHQYCCECLRHILNVAISAKSSATLLCPNSGCRNSEGGRIRLTVDDIAKFATPRQYRAIEEILTNEMLDLPNSGLKHCSTPGCAARYPTENGQHPVLIRCENCTRRYCAQCGALHAEEISCVQALAERRNHAEIRASEEWLAANTKQCPNCQRNIERSIGCNHMTCRGCGHQFCWLCMIPWPGYNNHACPTFGGLAPAVVPVVPAHGAPDHATPLQDRMAFVPRNEPFGFHILQH